jgi:BA14K-like protein
MRMLSAVKISVKSLWRDNSAPMGGQIGDHIGSGGPRHSMLAPRAGEATANCEERFRSYDPRTGTYLGYDGARHAFPKRQVD